MGSLDRISSEDRCYMQFKIKELLLIAMVTLVTMLPEQQDMSLFCIDLGNYHTKYELDMT